MARLLNFASLLGIDPYEIYRLECVFNGQLIVPGMDTLNKGVDLDISANLTGTPIMFLGMFKKPIIVCRDASYDYIFRLDRDVKGLVKPTEIYRVSAGKIRAITEARGLLFIGQDDGIYTLNIDTGDSSVFNSSIYPVSSIASRDGADLLVGTDDGKVYYIDSTDAVTDYTDTFNMGTVKIVSTIYAHSIGKWVVGSSDGKVKLASPDFATITDETTNWGVSGLGYVFDILGLGVIFIHGSTVKLYDGAWKTISTGLSSIFLACADYFRGKLMLIDDAGNVEVANIPMLKFFNKTVKANFTVDTTKGSSLGMSNYLS